MATATKEKKAKKAKRTKEEKKRLIIKILLIALGVIAGIAVVMAITNIGVTRSLVKMTKTYDAVKYEDRIVPEKDENGGWVFKTDRELRVMHLTDIHFGSGFMSYSKDKMAINAVATNKPCY